MGAGEYTSMRVQREVFERLIHDEAHELATDPEGEVEEQARRYEAKGMPADVARAAAEALMRDPEVALDTHARDELGLDPHGGLGSPWGAAGSSLVAFAGGALVPLVPFMFGSGVGAAVASAVASGVTLFVVGSGLSLFTGRPFGRSGARMLLIGALAASATYGIGRLIDVTTAI